MHNVKARILGTAAVLIFQAACANLNTIDRTTHLPKTGDEGSGRAVHLDAEQRLMIVNEFGQYCAEPSPDALAAYAASLGVGVGIQGTGSGSLAAGQQSSAASIGLRTQSITLMRDALYRMCEAYANGSVGSAQIATLLGRSQDLTAVILAVEQLTGATTARQVALTGETAADASATVLATQDLLAEAIDREERAQERLEEAERELLAAKAERDAADRALQEAQQALNSLRENDAPDEAIQEAEAEVDFRQNERERAQLAVKSAQSRRDLRQKALDSIQQARETIEENQDASTTMAAASTGSGARFGSPGSARSLNADATKAVAGAVETMVTTVLDKEYNEDSCMAVITHVPRRSSSWTPRQWEMFEEIQTRCFEYLNLKVTSDLQKLQTTSGIDSMSRCIDRWLEADRARRQTLLDWIADRDLKVRISTLITAKEYSAQRARAIAELGIDCRTEE